MGGCLPRWRVSGHRCSHIMKRCQCSRPLTSCMSPPRGLLPASKPADSLTKERPRGKEDVGGNAPRRPRGASKGTESSAAILIAMLPNRAVSSANPKIGELPGRLLAVDGEGGGQRVLRRMRQTVSPPLQRILTVSHQYIHHKCSVPKHLCLQAALRNTFSSKRATAEHSCVKPVPGQ